MLLGVISDSHLYQARGELSRLVEKGGAFEKVDLVLHAGDMTSLSVLDAFYPKKVAAVCGNMDGREIADLYPQKQVLELEGFRIGLIHGWGARSGLRDRIIPEFGQVDAIVYGHTHQPYNEAVNGILLFNPGSFHEHAMNREGGSVGLLTLGDDIKGQIVYL